MTRKISDEEQQHLSRHVFVPATQRTPASDGAIVAYRLAALIAHGDGYEEFNDDLECAAGAVLEMDVQQLEGFVEALIDILGQMAEQCDAEAILATLNRGYRAAGRGQAQDEGLPPQDSTLIALQTADDAELPTSSSPQEPFGVRRLRLVHGGAADVPDATAEPSQRGREELGCRDD